MSQTLPIFVDPDSFEAYCQGVADRLQARWDEQDRLLRSATERLESLQRIAAAVQDIELERELSEHLQRATERLQVLDSVRPGDDGHDRAI